MNSIKDPKENLLYAGAPPGSARAVMICVHGRGADAADILSLAEELSFQSIAYAAPQADNNSWYPFSFLEPVEKNEPYLSAAILTLRKLTDQMLQHFSSDKIFYLGFSQGACLILEYAARNPMKYGGIFALSGALIGNEGGSFEYEGKLADTPVFLGCSDPDPHIPIERVNLTETILNKMNAEVIKRIYPQMGHTVNFDELSVINELIEKRISL